MIPDLPGTDAPSEAQCLSANGSAEARQQKVIGGSLNEVRSNETRVFDPTTRVWASKSPYPGTARDHMGVASVGSNQPSQNFSTLMPEGGRVGM